MPTDLPSIGINQPAPDQTPDPSRREVLARRVRFIVAFTIAYNVIEAVVALFAGVSADSSALLGFGLDSVIEVSSAAAVAWQFSGGNQEARERAALRVIAFSFFALAVFVTYQATASLISGDAAEHSSIGIGIAALSLLIMPAASWFERRTGNELGSHSAVADSKQTLLCTYMSAALLIGLVANSFLGWWWADPIAALFIAGLAVREGVNAWRGNVCCSPAGAFFEDEEEHDHQGCGTSCSCC